MSETLLDRLDDIVEHNEKTIQESEHTLRYGREACASVQKTNGEYTVRVELLTSGLGNDDLLEVESWSYDSAGWAINRLNKILENGVTLDLDARIRDPEVEI